MATNEFNQSIIKEFRTSGGKVGGPFEHAALLILTTKGAKSGKTRENPLAYIKDGDDYIIIASWAGAPKNPPWYYNLLAHPEVTVEVGTERFVAKAQVVDEPRRSALYAQMEKVMPPFADYRQKTSRKIPVISLTPIG